MGKVKTKGKAISAVKKNLNDKPKFKKKSFKSTVVNKNTKKIKKDEFEELPDFEIDETLDSENDESDFSEENETPKKASKKTKKPTKNIDEDSDSDDDLDPTAHAKSLERLKDTDPEFYEFLKENDQKLLNFQINSDQSEAEDEENEEDEDDDSKLHKPDSQLHEGGSDESDFEDKDQIVSKRKITLKMVNEWQTALQSTGKIEVKTFSTVVKAFHAALMTVAAPEENAESEFIIEGSGVFNAVIQMCVLYLQPALKRILGLQTSNRDPNKCKRWVKVKKSLKGYFVDLFKLLGGVTSNNILVVLLKHLHQMSSFLSCYPSLAKTSFRRLTSLWSTSEETVRVLAFLSILRITRNNQGSLLEGILKMMYLTYVKGSKFVSPTTWPNIAFMRRSLVEMYALDPNVSYQYVFLYIRQLAIHLRNAIVLHKKENIQAVYNWQFVNSLHLWAELLALTKSKSQMQSLIYPLVMLITNTIKLIPTAQYYPLRFQCVQILIKLSRDSGTYIPIAPFLLEVLTSYDFSKKHKKISMKPLNFSCILRLSKSQLSENGFKDAVIDQIYGLLLECLSLHSHSIAFPDIVVPCVIQLKMFLKKCTVANYCKKMKQVLEKIEENAQFVEKERRNVNFQLKDDKLIAAWETTLKNKETPLQKYFDNWNKLNNVQKRKSITKNDELAEELPVLKKRVKKSEDKNDDGPVELFPSDDENDDDIMKKLSEGEALVEEESKKKKTKKDKKKKKLQVKDIQVDDDLAADQAADEVTDFNVNEW